MKYLLACLAALLVSTGCNSTSRENISPEGKPFAVLRFKVSGCMSCSHCRSVIRQTERGAGEGRTLSVGEEEAELRFFKPDPIDIKMETERLLSSGIIRFQIHEVELSARGTLEGSTFVVEASGQVFKVEGSATGGPGNREVRAMVDHWDNPEKMTLKLP